METQKDSNQNIGQSVSVNQGHSLQTNSVGIPVKRVSDLVSAQGGMRYSFLYKKTEKLVSATYLITGFLSDSEPMKWSMRQSGVSIVSDVAALGSCSKQETSLRAKKIMSDIESMVSLLGVARVAGYVSEMNYNVLTEEYRSLALALETRKSDWSQDGFVFVRELFSAPEKDTVSLPAQTSREEIKDKKNIPETAVRPVEKQTDKIVKTVTEPKVITPHVTPKKIQKSSRRETIITLVKDIGEISIKDIVSHFSDCGEKTIQRELAALVQDNVLKKTGDRRWSKYSLV